MPPTKLPLDPLDTDPPMIGDLVMFLFSNHQFGFGRILARCLPRPHEADIGLTGPIFEIASDDGQKIAKTPEEIRVILREVSG